MSSKTLYKIFIFISLSYVATSWYCTGHLLAWAMAIQELGNPFITNKIKTILESKDEGLPIYKTLYQYACWADDFKDEHADTEEWHFINIPFFDGSHPEIPEDPNNAASIINNARDYLLNHKSQLLEVKSSNSTYSFGKNGWLRFLLHLITEVHQPYHVTTRYSKKHEKGDDFGKKFDIVFTKDSNTLHQLWNRCFENLIQLKDPYTTNEIVWLEDTASSWMIEFPRSTFAEELKQKDGNEIAKNTWNYAVNLFYKNIEESNEPSYDYQKQGYHYCKKLITLAGYRISDFLSEIFLKDEQTA